MTKTPENGNFSFRRYLGTRGLSLDKQKILRFPGKKMRIIIGY